MEAVQSKTCPICFENVIKVKKLLACGHALCEKCLLYHVKNLKHELESEAGTIQCPICRAVYDIPKDTDVVAWVQSLEDMEVQSARPAIVCAACQAFEKDTTAEVRCINCDESLCKTCFQIRHSIEQLSGHITVSIDIESVDDQEEYELLKKYLRCSTHPGNLLSFICEDENAACCQECVLGKHRSCSKVVDINKIAKKDSNDRDTERLKEKIACLTAYSKHIIAAKRENEIENKKQKATILDSIKEMRRKVNDVLDVLEETVTEQCIALTKKNNLTGLDDIEILREINKELSASDSLITNLERYNSEHVRQVVLGNLDSAIHNIETRVLEMGGACKKYSFELVTQDTLNSMTGLWPNDSSKLAIVREMEQPAVLPEYTRRKLLRNCVVTYKSVHQVIARDSSFDWPPVYSSFVCLGNGKVFLVDGWYGFCCLLTEDFKLISSCNLMTHKLKNKEDSRIPYYVTHVKDNIVAISIPKQSKILFVEADSNFGINAEITTKYPPKALHRLRNGEFAVSWDGPTAFGIIALTSSCSVEEKIYFDRDSAGRIFSSFDYMAIDEEWSRVLQSSRKSKSVFCFDFQGKPKFSYMPPDGWNPAGIALDRDGNAYICDNANNAIHVLSIEGQAIKVLKDGIPQNPIFLGFYASGRGFLVTSSDRYSRKCVYEYEVSVK